MKRTIIVFVVAALILATTVLWFSSSKAHLHPMDIMEYGIILLLIGFALFFGYKRLSSARRGEPTEDELSKKVMQRTAALSYYISLYLWLAVMYFSDRLKMETHTIIGMGILGMAVTFAFCWLVINFRGIRNE